MSLAALSTLSTSGTPADGLWQQRAAAIDWQSTIEALHQQGNAVLPNCWTPPNAPC